MIGKENSLIKDPLYRLSGSNFLGRRPTYQYDPLHFVSPGTDWSDVFSLEDFENILANQRLRPEEVVFLENGVRPSIKLNKESYFHQLEGTALCNTKLLQIYKSGFTGIKVPFIDKHLKKLNEFKKALAQKVRCPVSINAYYSPKGSAPFLPVHRDPYDIFVIQVSGSKRFYCGKICQKENETSEQHLLHAGDTFFLPEDVPHWAEAVDSNSLHLTIGLHKIPTEKYLEFILNRHRSQIFSQNQYGVTDYPSNSHLLTELSELIKSEKKFSEFLDYIINS